VIFFLYLYKVVFMQNKHLTKINFINACETNDVEHIKQYFTSNNYMTDDMFIGFRTAIEHRSNDVVKYIHDNVTFIPERRMMIAFNTAVSFLNYESVELLINSPYIIFENNLSFIPKYLDITKKDKRKYVILRKKILNLLFDNETFLKKFLIHVHLSEVPHFILKILYYKVQTNDRDKKMIVYHLLISSSMNDDLKTFKYLYRRHDINDKALYNIHFRHALDYNSLKIIKFLLDKDDVDVDMYIESVLLTVKNKSNCDIFLILLSNLKILKKIVEQYNSEFMSENMQKNLIKYLGLKSLNQLKNMSNLL